MHKYSIKMQSPTWMCGDFECAEVTNLSTKLISTEPTVPIDQGSSNINVYKH